MLCFLFALAFTSLRMLPLAWKVGTGMDLSTLITSTTSLRLSSLDRESRFLQFLRRSLNLGMGLSKQTYLFASLALKSLDLDLFGLGAIFILVNKGRIQMDFGIVGVVPFSFSHQGVKIKRRVYFFNVSDYHIHCISEV